MRALSTLLVLGATAIAGEASAGGPRATLGQGGNDLTGRLAFQGRGPLAPSIAFELRADLGPNLALLGPDATFWRAQPELLVGVRPAAGLQLVAGGGLGSAYVTTTTGGPRVSPTVSGAAGALFRWEGVPVSAMARTEGVGSFGWAATLSVGLDLGAPRRR